MAAAAPALSVVVATRGRPLRLRWLLEALCEQTIDDFEVIVAHDSDDPALDEFLDEHRLGVRKLRCPPSGPAAKRNAAWRIARAPVVVFTDDDCRPPATWLEQVRRAVREHEGSIVQGATHPDPDEWKPHMAPLFSTQMIDPPTKWGQTCNIAYPRQVLERLEGFDAQIMWGEDTDLLQRALAAGTPLVAAPEAESYHAVEDHGLVEFVRRQARWYDLPEVVRRHPVLRDGQPWGGLFWKPTHPTLIIALVAGAGAAATSRRWPLLLVLPWARSTWPWHGRHWRGRLRSLLELPRRFVIDLTEVVALARGSWRSRTFFL